jgi:phosphatidylglycerophosphate synthase
VLIGAREAAARRPPAGARAAVAAVGAAIAGAGLALGLPAAGAAAALALYGAAAGLVLAGAAEHAHDRFGLANAVTLGRLGGACLLAGFLAAPGALAGDGGWIAAGAAALLALDGVDGWAARRQGLASEFGARFDMETDALTILVLAALALALEKAGPWVLALGAMRYAFVLAGAGWPRLARPLPPSWRRKAVCVAQLAVLTALMAPPVGPPLSAALAAAALVALVWSFAVDLRWLLRARS